MSKVLFLFLTPILLAGLACSLGGEAATTAPSPAVVSPTLAVETTAVSASATTTPQLPPDMSPTAAPTSTQAPPSATLVPVATATPALATATVPVPAAPTPERIVFPAGATGATVDGEVGSVESDRYLLRALADQIMSVRLTTPGTATMLLTIQGADGTLLKRDAVGGPTWSGPLPATQDYAIAVRTAGQESAAYALEVSVSPLPALAPERISFAPGANSATLEGTLNPQGDVSQFVLAAAAGQRMEVAVTSDMPGTVIYSLRDSAGQTLAITTDPTPLVVFLPETGDYLITLTTHNIAPAVAYTLTVDIADAGTVPEPERITFAAGSTSATVVGTIPSGGSDRYILRALGEQTMTLEVAAEPAGALTILVETEGGRFLTSGGDAAPLTLVLPSTQDYRIILTTPLAAPAVTYELSVNIR